MARARIKVDMCQSVSQRCKIFLFDCDALYEQKNYSSTVQDSAARRRHGELYSRCCARDLAGVLALAVMDVCQGAPCATPAARALPHAKADDRANGDERHRRGHRHRHARQRPGAAIGQLAECPGPGQRGRRVEPHKLAAPRVVGPERQRPLKMSVPPPPPP